MRLRAVYLDLVLVLRLRNTRDMLSQYLTILHLTRNSDDMQGLEVGFKTIPRDFRCETQGLLLQTWLLSPRAQYQLYQHNLAKARPSAPFQGWKTRTLRVSPPPSYTHTSPPLKSSKSHHSLRTPTPRACSYWAHSSNAARSHSAAPVSHRSPGPSHQAVARRRQ